MRAFRSRVVGHAAALPLLVVLALAGQLLAPAAGSGRGGHHGPDVSWDTTSVPSGESLRGLDAVDRRTAWVAGDGGGVWRTTDGGRSWRDVAPEGSEGLLFRDVEVLGRRTAVVLAIGEGEASRIYRTTDAGRSWRAVFVNDEPAAFYDCMDFWHHGRRGLAMSDPVDGRFRILATDDAGRTWRVLPDEGMPEAVAGEFAFAASGTCVETAGRDDAWIASGGAASRIFHSRDGGHTWSVADAPIPASAAGGVFSLAFDGPRRGVAVGGDFLAEDDGADASAYSRDGDSWTGGGDLGGYRSGVDWLPHAWGVLVAVGPNGSDLTEDAGRTWRPLGRVGYHAVDCVRRDTCWTSGSQGRVGRLSLRR